MAVSSYTIKQESMDSIPDPKKLIINYLPQAMTDMEFSELFMTCGKTTSTKVMRDRGTGYSFGYGFVEYTTDDEAKVAIEKLNGWTIGGKSLKVAYSKPPSGDKTKNVNLYLTGLSKETNEDRLYEIFSDFGTVVNAKVVRDKHNNESKGNGFVLFNDKESAEKAMTNLQGHTDGTGMKLVIKYAKDSVEQQRSNPHFQQYLQKQYQQQSAGFYQQDPQFGGPYDDYSYQQQGGFGQGGYGGMSRGNMAGGRGNVRGRGGQRFNPMGRPQGGMQGGQMGMQGGQMGMQGGQDNIVFVYNIGKEAQEADMYGLFAQYGRITKVDLMHGKGFAFIHMPVEQEAQTAIHNTNGIVSPISGLPLQVSFKKR